jgi:hypothetical protein
VAAGQLDQGRAHERCGIGVVDGHRPARAQRFLDHLALPCVAVADVLHQILAHMHVRCREVRRVEGGLAGCLHADEDDQLDRHRD